MDAVTPDADGRVLIPGEGDLNDAALAAEGALPDLEADFFGKKWKLVEDGVLLLLRRTLIKDLLAQLRSHDD